MKVKIYYHHTDAGGVVYYANYLKFAEEARTEFFAERGISIKELADAGTLFVVTRQETEHLAPAFYGDLLQVETQVSRLTSVRIEFTHTITNHKTELICRAKACTACVDAQLKPKAIPEAVAVRLAPMRQDTLIR
ncbi:MAG TPA: YbgC/FadM family acyl-CoA thioesterase [Patescibacteria group bacterium]|nr:YbgC/FadM family acyl-CoA thioesterase [Patescibacteria group bacterium]